MKDEDQFWVRGPAVSRRRPVRAPHRTTQVRPLTEAEQRAKWCREHGTTVEEFEARKDDTEWIELIKRRGRIA